LKSCLKQGVTVRLATKVFRQRPTRWSISLGNLAFGLFIEPFNPVFASLLVYEFSEGLLSERFGAFSLSLGSAFEYGFELRNSFSPKQ
jgi:FAD synthase